ncbi:PqiC family protein [Kiritimatiellaeota bacterium B1221]|nr:PqiC family protein [Kiritimatiellaeota bacterium B1221]
MKTLLLLSLPLLFAGCLSPSASPARKYYQLQEAEITEVSKKKMDFPFLVIGPVDVSPYLDQSKFALRVNSHEIEYQEYQRWAEPLELNISSILAANLRQYFQTTDISPTAPKLLLGQEQSRVMILINRMDVDTDGKAFLSIQWAMLNREKKNDSIVHEKDYQTTVSQNDMLGRVTALNRLITEFSLDLAKGIEKEL